MALTAAAVELQPSTPARLKLPEFSSQTRLLVIAPHPDDETIANGLLIQQVRAAGGAVKILLLTAGDNNPWPQRWLERRVRIAAADRKRWGQRRDAELERALQLLDVPSEALQKLHWPDMGVTDVLLHDGRRAIATLAAAIDAFRPSVIAMPSLEDRHPDHGSAYVLTRLALAGRMDVPQQLTYLIHGHADRDRFVEVTGTSTQSTSKLQALTAHESQMALSGRRMRRLAERPERYADVPSTRAASSTVLPWRPSAWLQPRLRLSLADRSEIHTWPWSLAPLQRDSDGAYRLAPSVQSTDSPRFVRLACDLPTPWIFDHWGWCEL